MGLAPRQGAVEACGAAGCFVTEQTTQALTADAQLTGQQTLIYVQLSISSERVYGVTVWSSHLGGGGGLSVQTHTCPRVHTGTHDGQGHNFFFFLRREGDGGNAV